MYVAMPVEFDIPEVGDRETTVAFEIDEMFKHRGLPGGAVPAVKVGGLLAMREYGGQLYRCIGSLYDLDTYPFTSAFSHHDEAATTDPTSGISLVGCEPGNPIASAIRRQHDWQLEKGATGTSGRVAAWPRGTGDRNGRQIARNATDFLSIAPTTRQLNEPISEISRRMIDTQAAKLLFIGRNLWMVSRPPAWRVSVEFQAGSWQHVNIDLCLATVIEGFDPKLARRHFPMDRLDEAQEYAVQCAKSNSTDSHLNYHVNEYVVDHIARTPELLDFDGDAEELAKIGFALAGECMRHSRSAPKTTVELGHLQHRLEEAFAITEATNYVLGETGDIAPYVEDLCEIWKRFSRPLSYCESGVSGRRFGDLLLRRAKKLYENAPIELGMQFQSQATATSRRF
jgi:hypothetical protein